MKSDIFSKDWFVRGKDFIGGHTEGLGWAEGYKNLCEFLYSPSELDSFSMNRNALENEFTALASGITSFNTLKVDPEGDDSMTNGKEIIISNKPLFENKDRGYGMDVLMGLVMHECSHCKYTSFNVTKGSNDKFVHNIFNILEDELIEEKLVTAHPGYAGFLGKVKQHYFKNNNVDDINNSSSDIVKIIGILLYIIRFPEMLERITVLDKYESLFIQIKKELDGLEFFGNITKTQESDSTVSYRAAIIIAKLIRDKYGKENDTDVQSISTIVDGNSIGESSSECHSDDTYNVIRGRKIVGKINATERKIIAALNRIKDYELSQRIPVSSIGYNKPTTIDKAMYDKLYSSIQPYINKTIKIIDFKNGYKSEQKQYNNLRNGQLDPSKLAAAMMNVSDIHKRVMEFKKKTTNNVNVVIMVDESGSMTNITKLANKLVVLFYEAMNRIEGINLYVYGHGDNVNQYITPKVRNKYVLGHREKQSGQNESKSYSIIMDEVLAKKKIPTLVINITDSEYMDNLSNVKRVLESYKDIARFAMVKIGDSLWGNSANDELYGEGNYILIDKIDNNFTNNINKLSELIKRNTKDLLK